MKPKFVFILAITASTALAGILPVRLFENPSCADLLSNIRRERGSEYQNAADKLFFESPQHRQEYIERRIRLESLSRSYERAEEDLFGVANFLSNLSEKGLFELPPRNIRRFYFKRVHAIFRGKKGPQMSYLYSTLDSIPLSEMRALDVVEIYQSVARLWWNRLEVYDQLVKLPEYWRLEDFPEGERWQIRAANSRAQQVLIQEINDQGESEFSKSLGELTLKHGTREVVALATQILFDRRVPQNFRDEISRELDFMHRFQLPTQPFFAYYLDLLTDYYDLFVGVN